MNQHNPPLTPDEVEVGRRNLIAMLRTASTDATTTIRVNLRTVDSLVAVLEALKPVVVDREVLGRALGLTIAGLEAKDESLLEWARCVDCRQPGEPCPCSGDPMARPELIVAVLAALYPKTDR